MGGLLRNVKMAWWLLEEYHNHAFEIDKADRDPSGNCGGAQDAKIKNTWHIFKRSQLVLRKQTYHKSINSSVIKVEQKNPISIYLIYFSHFSSKFPIFIHQKKRTQRHSENSISRENPTKKKSRAKFEFSLFNWMETKWNKIVKSAPFPQSFLCNEKRQKVAQAFSQISQLRPAKL